MSLKFIFIALTALILPAFNSGLSIPHQGSLELDGKHKCGVTVVSLSLFLTSAQCVQNVDPKKLVVRGGTIKRGDGGKVVQVKEIKIHPNFNKDTLDYDLAILIPEKPFESFGPVSEAVHTIEMDSGNEDLTGKEAIISGWGYDETGTGLTETLMYAKLPILSRSVCSGLTKITDRNICAGILEGGHGACDGDEGGPVQVGYKLVGIISKVSCGKKNVPDLFTDIRVLRPWIDENLKNVKTE